MSGDHPLPVPCSKQTVFASSKLVDPQNTAEPIRSHKHAIEQKHAAELANKELGGAVHGSPDSRPSGNHPPYQPHPDHPLQHFHPPKHRGMSISHIPQQRKLMVVLRPVRNPRMVVMNPLNTVSIPLSAGSLLMYSKSQGGKGYDLQS